MNINVIYKETLSYCGRKVQKVDLIEVEENEIDAGRYAKLYNLQSPVDDKNKVLYKVVPMTVS